MNRLEKIQQRTRNLETEVITSLVDTNLISDVKIKGDLGSKENSLCLEYSLKDKKDEARVRALRTQIVRLLIKNHPEILEVRKEDKPSGYRKEYIKVNPQTRINEPELRYSIIQDLKKAVSSYLRQTRS